MEAEIHADYKKDNKREKKTNNGDTKEALIHRYYRAVEIDGQTYRVKTTEKETRDLWNRPYSHEVTKIELLKEMNSSLASEERKEILSSSEQRHGPKNKSPLEPTNLGKKPDSHNIKGVELLPTLL